MENNGLKNDDNYQGDLFEAKYDAQKDRKAFFSFKFMDQRFLPYVKVPVEYFVMMGIGLLLLCVVSFAIGVERGKSVIRTAEAVSDTSGEMKALALPDDYIAETVNEVTLAAARADQSVIDEVIEEEGKEKVSPVTPPAGWTEDANQAPAAGPVTAAADASQAKTPVPGKYVIQLASFSRESDASSLAEQLKKKGKNAVFNKSGKFYQVYADGYKTMEEARKAQSSFAKDYPDCYVRKK